MMKKMMVLLVVVAIALSIGVNIVNACTCEITDLELVGRYVQENYGDEYYGVYDNLNNNEFVDFMVYDLDHDLVGIMSINREWYIERIATSNC